MLLAFSFCAAIRYFYCAPFFWKAKPFTKFLSLIATCLLAPLLETAVAYLLLKDVTNGIPRAIYVLVISYRILSYTTWNSLYLLISFLVQKREMEVNNLKLQLANQFSELRELQAQLNPHFLFNSLNVILAVSPEPQKVQEVTSHLASYLRFSLHKARPLEPLARELDEIGHYLTLHRYRLGDKLEWTVDCDLAARTILVPPMLIQPLLENALKYGQTQDKTALRVLVTATVEEDWLSLSVANTGCWVKEDSHNSPGTGLKNLQQRLHLLIGDQASLTWKENDGWVLVCIRIPCFIEPAFHASNRTSI